MPTPDILPPAAALAATDSSLGAFQLTVETHREELEDDTAIFHGNHLMPAFFQSELLP